MLISARQIHAYIGVPYHEPVPYPNNWLTPGNSDPVKYEGMPNVCPNCKKVVDFSNKGNADNINIYNFSCPHCNARFSYPSTDKSWSSYGQTPGTLNEGMGSNSDMPGYGYHPGANSNQDTFSSNLGKAALSISYRTADLFDKMKPSPERLQHALDLSSEEAEDDVRQMNAEELEAFITDMEDGENAMTPQMEPKIHSVVDVHNPGVNDMWNNEFRGTVVEIDRSVKPVIYNIQDQEENVFGMNRDQFDYPTTD